MPGGHPDKPNWYTPPRSPSITVRKRGSGANEETETIIPAEIVKLALGSASHPTPPKRHGDTLYALGGRGPIRWNFASRGAQAMAKMLRDELTTRAENRIVIRAIGRKVIAADRTEPKAALSV